MSVEELPIEIRIFIEPTAWQDVTGRLGQLGVALEKLGKTTVELPAPKAAPLREMKSATKDWTVDLDKLRSGLGRLDRTIDESTEKTTIFRRATLLASRAQGPFTSQIYRVIEGERKVAEVTETGEKVIKSFGEESRVLAGRTFHLGVALHSLTRDLFWTGLGIMFLAMSFARLRRSGIAVERQQVALKRAYRDLNRVNKEAAEAVLLYGKSSEESREAQERLIEAEERVKLAEESVRMAVEQRIYSEMMLWAGTIPTAMRTGEALATMIWYLWSARSQLLFQLRSLIAHEAAKIPVDKAAAGSTLALGASAHLASWGFWALYLSLTAGVAIIGLFLAEWKKAEAMKEAEERIRRMRLEVEELNTSLSASPGLAGKLKVVRKELRSTGSTLHSLGITRLPELRTGGMGIRIGQVNITITAAPGERVRAIRRELNELFFRHSRGRGL